MSSSQEEKSKLDVHSANSWEKADLGDKSRNEKFLRLMGAAKKEHHGRFVIGDNDSSPSHTRPKKEERHVEEELEEQYQHSMEHRIVGGKKGHIGLGFHEEEDKGEKDKEEDKKQEEEKKEKEDDNTKKEEDSPGKDEDLSEKKEKDDSRKRESLDIAGPEDEEVKKMKFVKSS